MAVIFGLYALGIISEATNVKMVSFGVLVSLHLVPRNEADTQDYCRFFSNSNISNTFTKKVLLEDEKYIVRYYF